MLITVASRDDRDDVLDRAKRLKDRTDTYKKIYIKKDVHQSVRDKWRRLREAEKKEKEKPEKVGLAAGYIGDPGVTLFTCRRSQPSACSLTALLRPLILQERKHRSSFDLSGNRCPYVIPEGRDAFPPEEDNHFLASLPDELLPRISEWLISKGDTAIEYKTFRGSPREKSAGKSSPNGSERKLDLLRALWLLRLPESIRAVLPNAEGMDEDDLQQMADRLSDAQVAAGRHINAAPFASSTAPTPEEDDIAAINHAPGRARQH
ncbi:hypothetical protein E2C01_039706 [Portunus trituberculatus]|uniref:Uncharacterized protein n=1 Tax=Portunus trituberculatus TaxID=210409 RepID=A0A5B7FLF9_PORTR|nr:hypothetical protein [Portunus trituberculatus]